MAASPRIAVVALFVVAVPGLTAQSSSRPAVGDSVQLELLTTITEGGSRTSAARRRLSGRLARLDSAVLTLRQGDVTRELALARLSNVRVLREVPNPGLRGLKSGAVAGAAVLGTVTFVLTMCRPAIFGEGGCMGPPNASEVASFTLKGAALGAATGALTGALFGAVLSPSREWRAADLSVSATTTATESRLSIRLQLDPRPGLRADLYLRSF